MWAWMLIACAPGVLRTREGSEPLRSAWYAEVTGEAGASSLYVLAANSDLLCELPDSDDPAVVDEALVRQSAGFYREGAKVLYGVFTDATGEGWPGTYEIADATSAGERPDREVALTWWSVVEAEVQAQDGVVVSYSPGDSPGDYSFVPRAPPPGEFTLTEDEHGLAVEFEVSSLDLSGRFEASSCDPDSALFASLGYSF